MDESTRGSLYFFFSGVWAAVGVNLVTSLVGNPELFLSVIWSFPPWFVASLFTAIAASFWDMAGRLSDNRIKRTLSIEEQKDQKKNDPEITSLIRKARIWEKFAILIFLFAVGVSLVIGMNFTHSQSDHFSHSCGKMICL